MNRLALGALLGLAAGFVDVLLMLPMKLPDKPTALAAVFFSRFAIGFLMANLKTPFQPALRRRGLIAIDAFDGVYRGSAELFERSLP
jgi:hypothetical protein